MRLRIGLRANKNMKSKGCALAIVAGPRAEPLDCAAPDASRARSLFAWPQVEPSHGSGGGQGLRLAQWAGPKNIRECRISTRFFFSGAVPDLVGAD